MMTVLWFSLIAQLLLIVKARMEGIETSAVVSPCRVVMSTGPEIVDEAEEPPPLNGAIEESIFDADVGYDEQQTAAKTTKVPESIYDDAEPIRPPSMSAAVDDSREANKSACNQDGASPLHSPTPTEITPPSPLNSHHFEGVNGTEKPINAMMTPSSEEVGELTTHATGAAQEEDGILDPFHGLKIGVRSL